MGILTVKHYRASKLPADLRAGLSDDALVSVTVEEERVRRAPASPESLKAQIDRITKKAGPSVSSKDAVERIRKLRDEWDD